MASPLIRTFAVSSALLVAASTMACQTTPPASTPVAQAQSPAEAPAGPTREWTIPFSITAGATPVDCAGSYTTADGVAWTLSDLRLFVHDVRLVAADGSEVPAPFVVASPWQNEHAALLDFAGGTAHCEGASPVTNTSIRVLGPAEGTFTGLRFRVGVPFAANHADPATATEPLQQMSMHWGWRAGYRFVRFDLQSGEQQAEVHFGSTNCIGETTAITSCGRPNVAEVAVQGDPSTTTVAIDLNQFLNAATIEAAHCMAANVPGCAASLSALGLNPETGASAQAAPAFSAAAPVAPTP